MSKHDHPEPMPPCNHASLKFCPKCDAIECTACGKEWKAQNFLDSFRQQMQQNDFKSRWPKYGRGPNPGLPEIPSPYDFEPKSYLGEGIVLCTHGADTYSKA